MNIKNNGALIFPDSESFEILAEYVAKKICSRIITHLENFNGASVKGDRWLTLAEAKKILPYSSKKKWKMLRDENEIEFSTFGRGFLYHESSIQEYLRRHSTLRARPKRKN